MMVLCGGVIPLQDSNPLFAVGVTAVYGPGTNITTSATELEQAINNLTETEKNEEIIYNYISVIFFVCFNNCFILITCSICKHDRHAVVL